LRGLSEDDVPDEGVWEGVALFVFGGFDPPGVDGSDDGEVDGVWGSGGLEDFDLGDLSGFVGGDCEGYGSADGGCVDFAGDGEARADGLEFSAEGGFDLPGAEDDGGFF
jgi:hypothetical protein